MNLDIASKSMLGIFFLYLVMCGSSIHMVLNCELQRVLLKNIYIRHIIIYFSIFIFTFVLNWYTPKSLVLTENMESNDDNNNNNNNNNNVKSFNDKYGYIISSLIYSIFIYIFFIFSTKLEPAFMFTFIILLIAISGTYIIYKIESENANVINTKNKLFISENDIEVENKENLGLLVKIHNIFGGGFLFLIINTIIGFFLYLKRQLRDHSKEWNWITFFLGTNYCNE